MGCSEDLHGGYYEKLLWHPPTSDAHRISILHSVVWASITGLPFVFVFFASSAGGCVGLHSIQHPAPDGVELWLSSYNVNSQSVCSKTLLRPPPAVSERPASPFLTPHDLPNLDNRGGATKALVTKLSSISLGYPLKRVGIRLFGWWR